MTNGVDARVHRVKLSDPDAVVDRAPTETGREELPAGDDSVLVRSGHAEPDPTWST